jgi:hypothetical protein
MNFKVFSKLSKVQTGSLRVRTLQNKIPKQALAARASILLGWWDGGCISPLFGTRDKLFSSMPIMHDDT